MHIIINDMYEKKRLEKEKAKGADIHIIDNTKNIQDYRRKKKK